MGGTRSRRVVAAQAGFTGLYRADGYLAASVVMLVITAAVAAVGARAYRRRDVRA